MSTTIGTTVIQSTVGVSATASTSAANGFFVIQSPWGVEQIATPVTSLSQFQQLFGGLNRLISAGANTWGFETNDAVVQGFYGVKNFLTGKGPDSGAIAYVTRVVAPKGATPSDGYGRPTKTFSDGYGNNTTVTSKWRGFAGLTKTVTITNPSPKGSAYARFVINFPQANIQETWDISTANDAANASKLSQLVTFSLPIGGQLPQTAAATNLAGGVQDLYDAADSDLVGSDDAAGRAYGLETFHKGLGVGQVMIPGKNSSVVRSGLAAHGSTYRRSVILGAAAGLTLQTVATDTIPSGKEVTYFWPRLWTIDVTGAGSAVLVDPCGAVAGNQALMDAVYGGVQKVAGGIQHPLGSDILDVERQSNGQELVNDSGSNTLADLNINTIRAKANGPTVWGAFTQSPDSFWRQIGIMRCGLVVEVGAQKILNQLVVLEPIDFKGKTFTKAKAAIASFMEDLIDNGSLYGQSPGNQPSATDAYRMVCDLTNNTFNDLYSGTVNFGLSYSPTPTAIHVNLNLQATVPGSK